MPALSVVMPVHNAARFLDEAIRSVLSQTYESFEFVILDDGSTDGSRDRLRLWAGKDDRIRLIEAPHQTGAVASSNRAVLESQGTFVARMDADDVCHPARLERQLKAMEQDPHAVLVGSTSRLIDEAGNILRPPDYARTVRPSRFAPFAHPTVMFRRAAFDRVGGYQPHAAYWEDVDLYLRLAGIGKAYVIADPLMDVRLSKSSTRATIGPNQLDEAMDRMYDYVLDGREAKRTKLHPRCFLARGSIALWAGHKARVLPSLLSRGDLRLNRATLRTLIWALWAELSPRSLLFFLRRLLARKNSAALAKLDGQQFVEWRPPALQSNSLMKSTSPLCPQRPASVFHNDPD